MKRFIVVGVAVASVFGWSASSVEAIAPFKQAFQKKYVDESGNEEFKAAFKEASCNVCHLKGKKKEERNEYGKALDELIEGNANKRIQEAKKINDDELKKVTDQVLEELEKAFEKVAEKKAASGETYGEMLKAGKLPTAE